MTMPNFCINFLNKAEKSLPILYDFAVASLADAWIKIYHKHLCQLLEKVASLADAWIKIGFMTRQKNYYRVAPFVGVWIKIETGSHHTGQTEVASLADAWIETWGAKNYIIHTKKRKEEKNGWNYYQKGNITYIRQWK